MAPVAAALSEPAQSIHKEKYEDIVDLVRRVELGDPAGMEELYQVLSGGIRFFLMRRLRHCDVEDKVHEIFVDVLSAIRRRTIRDATRLMGFVRTVIHRKVAKQIHRQVRRRGERVEGLEHVPDMRKTPEQVVASKEISELMTVALDSLSPRDRELLVRFYLWEQTGEQICREMSLSATQFRVFKSRAKARFCEVARRKAARPSPFLVPQPSRSEIRTPTSTRQGALEGRSFASKPLRRSSQFREFPRAIPKV